MNTGYFDIEANGLLGTITQVHCLAVSVNGNEPALYVGENIPEGLALLDECDEIVGHNIIGYDIPALCRLYGWRPKAVVRDTFVVSCLLHPDITGGHSIEAWGERLGEAKIDYLAAYITWRSNQGTEDNPYRYTKGEEWLAYNEVMGDYCQQDVRVLIELDSHLRNDEKGWDWEASIKMEHQFAKDFCAQGLRGVMVDGKKARALVASIDKEMAEIAAEVEPLLPPKPGTKGKLSEVTPPKVLFKKDGTPSANALKFFERIEHTGGGDGHYQGKFQGQWHVLPTPSDAEGNRLPLFTEFPATLADQQHIKQWLMDMGWKPTMWSYKKAPDKNGKLRFVRGDDGNLIPTWPKFHDKGELCPALEQIDSEFPHVKKVVKWIVLRHRRGLVQSIVDAIRADGTVPATGMALGTPTSRVTHSVVANIPKAEPDVLLGKECRGIFVPRPGRTLVGVDASGLELRCLAHYVGTDHIREMIVNGKKEDGTEIHTFLWSACKAWVKNRTIQKNVNYGWLYGASDKKLGQTAGHPDGVAEKVGKKIRAALVAAIPGLEDLMKKIEKAAKSGYVKAIDGRRIEIRSKHATLNTLLQSCGSILVKMATCYMNAQIRKRKLDAFMVIHYHDEVQLDAHPDHAQQAGELFIEGLRWAGHHVGFKCPLDGEVKLGKSWAETH